MKKTAAKKKAPTKRRRPAKKTGVKPVEKDESKQGKEWIDSAHTVTYEWTGEPIVTGEPDYKAIALDLADALDDILLFSHCCGQHTTSESVDLLNFIDKRQSLIDKYFDEDEFGNTIFK